MSLMVSEERLRRLASELIIRSIIAMRVGDESIQPVINDFIEECRKAEPLFEVTEEGRKYLEEKA